MLGSATAGNANNLQLRKTGAEILVSITTAIEVKIAFITAYRFDQTGSERWTNGKLVALNAVICLPTL